MWTCPDYAELRMAGAELVVANSLGICDKQLGALPEDAAPPSVSMP